MSTDLREELDVLAHTHTFSPDPAAWDRGRRARRRDRLAVQVGVTLAALATITGLASLAGLVPDRPGPADGGRVRGVPAEIQPVPAHLTGRDEEGRWTGPVEDDLALGTGAVAFVTDTGLPVLVTDDGAYHLLDLPGFADTSFWSSALGGDSPSMLTLSPDGTRLAWAWVDLPGRTDYTAAPAGIRVADLGTGGVTEVLLTDERSIGVTTLAWSPDSRWLAWRGSAMRQWNASGLSWGESVYGVLDPAGTSEVRPGQPRASLVGMAVDDAGRLTTLAQGGTAVVSDPGGTTTRTAGPTTDVGPRGAVGASGARAFGATSGAPGVVVTPDGRRSPLSFDTIGPEGADVEVLGWLGSEHVVVVARTRHGGSIDPPQIGLASTSPDDPGYRTLVGNAADGTEIDQLSVAVDLMSLDHPTVAPVDPDWPWSPERTWATVLAVVCLGLVLVGLARGAVRRRWRPRP